MANDMNKLKTMKWPEKDSREEIDADIERYRSEDIPDYLCVPVYRVLSWLYRQAMITEREVKKHVDLSLIAQTADALLPDYQERIDELIAERDELKTEIEKYERDFVLLFDEKRKLTAERDKLKAYIDRK